MMRTLRIQNIRDRISVVYTTYNPTNLKLVEQKTLRTHSNLYALAVEPTLKAEFM